MIDRRSSSTKGQRVMSLAHWIIVIAVATVLFGRNKISDLMGDMAKGIKDFRKGLAE